jgi:hypothetical protein
LAASVGSLIALGGCAGADIQIDAPVLEAAGIQLTSKKVEDDAPEHAGLVMPPSAEKLPEPGSAKTAAAQQQWPQDPDQIKKRKAEQEAAEREEYCVKGKWKDKADINEFNKDAGGEQRCPSKFGEAVAKTLNTSSASAQPQQN